jgi:hypothetical protein
VNTNCAKAQGRQTDFHKKWCFASD